MFMPSQTETAGHLPSWFFDFQTLLNEQNEKSIEKLPCLFLIALISSIGPVMFLQLFINDVTVSVDWLHLVKNYVHIPFQ